MAKNPIPKKVAGVRIPKRLRKSKTLRSLLNNPLGRELVASALTAGAAAAAGALVRDRDEVGHAAKAGAQRTARAGTVVSRAVHEAADAIIGVIGDAARSAANGNRRPRPDDNRTDKARH